MTTLRYVYNRIVDRVGCLFMGHRPAVSRPGYCRHCGAKLRKLAKL